MIVVVGGGLTDEKMFRCSGNTIVLQEVVVVV
jgi:hypothetical protein